MKMKHFIPTCLLLSILVFLFVEIRPVDLLNSERPDEATKTIPIAQPSEWSMIQRTFPFGDWDRNAYREALESAQRMKTASKRGAGLGTWELLGPTNIGGRIVDVEFDPIHPNIVYAAAATGGVFKSTDTGETWQPIFDDQAMLNIGDIGIDPTDPEVVYVGTGEANPSAHNLAGGGMYKSTNGGLSWSFVGLEHTEAVARIIVDPSNPDRVFVAAIGSYFTPGHDRGVYRSDDGGLSWSNVLSVSDSTGAIDLVMHPIDTAVLYAAMWERVRRPTEAVLFGPTSGIYRSVDGGVSWQKLGPSRGLPNSDTQPVGRIGLAISSSNPEILYALYTDGFDYLGLYKTRDGGDTWFDADPYRGAGVGIHGFSWFFGQVRVHPRDPEKVYILDVEFLRSFNGGRDWIGIPGNSVLHVDHHALAFHPNNPDYLIDGNDGGINISENAGLTWRKVDTPPTTQFYEVGLDPNYPERIYGGTQDNGVLRTLSGIPDDWKMLPFGIGSGGDGFYVIVAKENSDFIYAESQYGVLRKSTDGGATFALLESFLPYRYNGAHSEPGAEPRNWNTPVIMDPNDSAILYYGTNRIYRSTTRGTSWRAISGSLTDWTIGTLFGTVTTIAVAPSESQVIYAGTDDGHVWVTNDHGATWTDISETLPYRWVTRVAVDPRDEYLAYVTFSGLKWHDPQSHVFRTTNMGETWSDISGGLPDAPVNAFVVDPVDSDILYAGTDVGAFVSFNAGSSWESLGNGLPAVSIFDLDIHPEQHILVAGTHGRSMYGLDLSSIATVTEPIGPAAETYPVILFPNYPNPFVHKTTIPYHISQSGTVQMTVFDLLGREVIPLVNEKVEAGSYQTTWDGRDAYGQPVASGTYFLHLSSSDLLGSLKIQIITVIH